MIRTGSTSCTPGRCWRDGRVGCEYRHRIEEPQRRRPAAAGPPDRGAATPERRFRHAPGSAAPVSQQRREELRDPNWFDVVYARPLLARWASGLRVPPPDRGAATPQTRRRRPPDRGAATPQTRRRRPPDRGAAMPERRFRHAPGPLPLCHSNGGEEPRDPNWFDVVYARPLVGEMGEWVASTAGGTIGRLMAKWASGLRVPPPDRGAATPQTRRRRPPDRGAATPQNSPPPATGSRSRDAADSPSPAHRIEEPRRRRLAVAGHRIEEPRRRKGASVTRRGLLLLCHSNGGRNS